MSLVLRVISDAVENSLISFLEKFITFLNVIARKFLPNVAATLAAINPTVIEHITLIIVIPIIFSPVTNI